MSGEFDIYLDKSYSISEVVEMTKSVISDTVAIEGNVGTGKSTLATTFGLIYQCPHIGEYVNYVNFAGGESFPSFPPKDVVSVVSSNPMWFQLEFRRLANIIDVSKLYHGNSLLIERSPISLVDFEYAKMKQNIPYEITNLLGNYSMLMDRNLFKEPSKYIFLRTKSEIVKNRVTQRPGTTLNFLFDSKTCNAIDHFITFFKNQYLTKHQALDINTSNRTPQEILVEVSSFLNSNSRNVNKYPFRTLCNDILTGRIDFENI